MIAISMGVTAGIDAGPALGGGKEVAAGLFASTFERASGGVAGWVGTDGPSAMKDAAPQTAKDNVRDAAALAQAKTGVSSSGPSLGEEAKGIGQAAAEAADPSRGSLLRTAHRGNSATESTQSVVAQAGTDLHGNAAAASQAVQRTRTAAASGDDVAEPSVTKLHTEAKPLVDELDESVDEAAAANPAVGLPANTPAAAVGKVWTPLQTPKVSDKSSSKSQWQKLGSDATSGQNVTAPIASGASVVATLDMQGVFQAPAALPAQVTAPAATSTIPSAATVFSTSGLGAAGSAEFSGGRSLWAGATHAASQKGNLAAGSAGGPAKKLPVAEATAAQTGGSLEGANAAAKGSADGELAAVGSGAVSALLPAGLTMAIGSDGAAAKVSAVKQGKSVAASSDGKGGKTTEEKRQAAGTAAMDAAPSAAAPVHPVGSLHSATLPDGKLAGSVGAAAETVSGTTAVGSAGSVVQSAGLDVAPAAGIAGHVASAHAGSVPNGGSAGANGLGAAATDVSAGGVAQQAGSGDGIYPGMGSKTIEATPTVLEIGVPSGSHGWLKIRAEVGEGGAVQASMSSATVGGQDALHRELPAMNAFLQSEHVPVSLQIGNVAAGGSSTDGSGSGSGAGSTLDFSAGTGSSGTAGGEGSRQAAGPQSSSSPAAERADAIPVQSAWTEAGQYGGASSLGGGGWLNVMA
jgi:hypothetical protein